MASSEPHPTTPTEVVVVDEVTDVPDPLGAPSVPSLFARLGAEAFGTFGLILTILGAALYLQITGIGTLGTALAAGLVLAGLTAAVGHVSGGHFNPAVSLGAALSGRLSWVDLLLYWVAQVVGGIAAAAVLFLTVPKGLAEALTGETGAGASELFATAANGWGEHSPLFVQTEQYTTQAGLDAITFDLRAALVLEAVAAAIFVAVTIGVAARKVSASVGPFAIGITLTAMLLVTSLATGGGLNPARSTAAAIFAGGGALGQLWLFWLAPLLGAAIAGLFVLASAPVPAEPELTEEDDEDIYDEDIYVEDGKSVEDGGSEPDAPERS